MCISKKGFIFESSITTIKQQAMKQFMKGWDQEMKNRIEDLFDEKQPIETSVRGIDEFLARNSQEYGLHYNAWNEKEKADFLLFVSSQYNK